MQILILFLQIQINQKIYLGKKILSLAQNLKIICKHLLAQLILIKMNLREKNIKLISLTKEFNILKKISSTSELA